MIMGNLPKVLVISNNCFSRSGANGRTLGNFFIGWPKDSVAQFYISNEIPDLDVCDNYFRITDKETLKSFLKLKAIVGNKVERVESNSIKAIKPNVNSNIFSWTKRTPITMISRNIIWNSTIYSNRKFLEWVNNFDANVVLLQVGDSAFMIKLALYISKIKKIPLVLFNTESYYFKNKCYFRDSLNSRFYRLFHKNFQKEFNKAMQSASYCIYSNDLLMESYKEVFKHRGSVLYTTSSLKYNILHKENIIPIISYTGNLGIGRHLSLIDIGNVLQRINKDYHLDVYGKAPDEEVERLIKECEGIVYHGLVPYSDVISITYKSDVLIHCEGFSKFDEEDIRYGFSTKIADSLASGTCLLVYAPKTNAAVHYFLNNKAACVVTDKNELENTLKDIMTSKSLRSDYAKQAKVITKQNHSVDKNCRTFKDIIISVCKEIYDESNAN
jgi:hypothetical protein